MRALPPTELVELLDRLGCAGAKELRAVQPTVDRAARSAPSLVSLWVDALARRGTLTPFQAREIIAGRGNRLRLGDYLLRQPVAPLGYADLYRATDLTTGRAAMLLVAIAEQHRAEKLDRLRVLVERFSRSDLPGLAPPTAAGVAGERLFVACADAAGRSLTDCLMREGRFTPAAVQAIAVQMCDTLSHLDQQTATAHGDLHLHTIWLDESGQTTLLLPGVREVLLGATGEVPADTLPAMFDYVAPEQALAEPVAHSADRVPLALPVPPRVPLALPVPARVPLALPVPARVPLALPVPMPSVRTDLCAAGLIWWQLLTGRTPRGGGDAAGKLLAARAGRIRDVRRFAPTCPAPLADAVMSCAARDSRARPSTFHDVRQLLAGGDAAPRSLARLAASNVPLPERWGRAVRDWAERWFAPAPLAAAAVVLGAMMFGSQALWRGRDTAAKNTTPLKRPPAAAPRADAPPPVRLASHAVAKPVDLLLDPAFPQLNMAWLRDEQTVRAPDGQRVTLVVSRPIAIEANRVRFENIDFVLSANSPQQELIDARCAHIEFHGCTFRPEQQDFDPEDNLQSAATAIRWSGRAAAGQVAPASGRVHLKGCDVRDLVAVGRKGAGPLLVEAENTLLRGRGAVFAAARCTRLDEPTALRLKHCTLRGRVALAEIGCERLEAEPGPITVSAADSVFASEAAGLFVLRAPRSPAAMLRSIEWSGSGSLLAADSQVAAWVDSAGAAAPLADDEMNIAGLVRGQVHFAGPATGAPAGSRAVRWEAPRRSAEPPGIRREGPNIPADSPAPR